MLTAREKGRVELLIGRSDTSIYIAPSSSFAYSRFAFGYEGEKRQIHHSDQSMRHTHTRITYTATASKCVVASRTIRTWNKLIIIEQAKPAAGLIMLRCVGLAVLPAVKHLVITLLHLCRHLRAEHLHANTHAHIAHWHTLILV